MNVRVTRQSLSPLTPAQAARRALVNAPLPRLAVVHPKRIWGGCGIAHPEYSRNGTRNSAVRPESFEDAAQLYGLGWD